MTSLFLWAWPYLAVAFASIGVLVVAFVSGGNRQKDKQEAKDAKAYKATIERISNAPVDDDPAAIRKRLRERKP